ncbi:L-ascorbate oxidase-like protein [Nymphaea thermarum]|nr:L-ascorbate oxidase-like protein [Nymphaea thermarum]
MVKRMACLPGAWLMASLAVLLFTAIQAENPYRYFTWNITYGTISPLGVPQQGILINGQFPGPNINSTTNDNIVVNVFNHLDQPFLLSWSGIQQRRNSWQDGMPGTNCPIPPGQNLTYHFQVKDQIGSYFYFPSTYMHKAAGAFGGLRVNSRLYIPVPFDDPADDYTVLIGDWYTTNHGVLRRTLEVGKPIGKPDGVLINGKSGKTETESVVFGMEAGKTYRYRICNVGMKTSLNFRVQGHRMQLVEIEGSHTVQNIYDSLDVHLGQCYSVLITADQKPGDYLMIASTRFTKYMLNATALIRYANSKEPAPQVLPPAPVGVAWSLNQFRSFRWNLTASAARPNPQGSYHYGQINITRTIKILNSAGKDANGKLRYGINGISYVRPTTPLKLAQYFGVGEKVYNDTAIVDDPSDVSPSAPLTLRSAVLKGTYRDFVEIVFENHERGIQSWHLDGYSFFPVGMEGGRWSPKSRSLYNNLDAVSRHTIQVYPMSWTAILLTLDNAGMWNLRSEAWDRQYLGQQLYLNVVSPARSLRDENNIPENARLCGIVKRLPMPAPYT